MATRRYGGLTVSDVNEFLERLPRDMLFVMRTWSLVRNLNSDLGGTSTQRFLVIAEHAAAGQELYFARGHANIITCLICQLCIREQVQDKAHPHVHNRDAGFIIGTVMSAFMCRLCTLWHPCNSSAHCLTVILRQIKRLLGADSDEICSANNQFHYEAEGYYSRCPGRLGITYGYCLTCWHQSSKRNFQHTR